MVQINPGLRRQPSDAQIQFEVAPSVDGKPAWYGLYRETPSAEWKRVTNADGNPLSYASEGAAIAGAVLVLGEKMKGARH